MLFFRQKFKINSKKIINKDIVEQTLNASRLFIINQTKKRRSEDSDMLEVLRHIIVSEKLASKEDAELLSFDELDEMVDEILKKVSKQKIGKVVKCFTYYPISEYSIITKFNKNTHPSYIEAGKEICKEILENQELYLQNEPQNVIFAEKYLTQFP